MTESLLVDNKSGTGNSGRGGGRRLLLGDTSGIRNYDIATFVDTVVNYSYGGSFPNQFEDLPTKMFIKAAFGLSDEACREAVVCHSTRERAEQILAACNRHKLEHGEGFYMIIDKNPLALAEALKEVAKGNCFHQDTLGAMSIIQPGAPKRFDYKDEDTGIRATGLPLPLIPYDMRTPFAA